MANALPVSPTPPVAAPLQPAPPATPPSAPSAPPVMPATPPPVAPVAPVSPTPATPAVPAAPPAPPTPPAAPAAPAPSGLPTPPAAPTMMAGNANMSPPPKSGSPLPLILVGVVLLAAGAGAYFWYSNQQVPTRWATPPDDMAQTEQSDSQMPDNSEVVMATESDDDSASQIEAANRAAVAAAAAEGAVTKETNCYSIALPASSTFGDENSCNQFIEIPGEPSLNLIVEPIWGYKNFTTSAEAAAQAIISGEKLSESPLTVGGLEAIRVVDVTNASGDEHVMVFVVKKGSTYTVQGVPISGFEISTVFLNQDDKAARMAQFEAALNSIVWK